MPLVKLRKFNQLTIPKKLKEKMALKEGDYFEVEVNEQGILFKPLKAILIDKQQLNKEIIKELVELNRKNPVKEVSEEELEAMTEKAKREVFERYYGKIE